MITIYGCFGGVRGVRVFIFQFFFWDVGAWGNRGGMGVTWHGMICF